MEIVPDVTGKGSHEVIFFELYHANGAFVKLFELFHIPLDAQRN
jgi:hypothetical protein